MLLDGEWTGVERDTKDLDVGEETCPEATDGEGEQLGDNLGEAPARSTQCAVRTREQTYSGDRDGGIPEEEELVHAGEDDGPDETDGPSAECVHRHVRIVGVSDGRSNLGVRRVILWTFRLESVPVRWQGRD